MKRQFKMNHYARMRKIMSEYGFPLSLVMRGSVMNGRYYLKTRTK